MNIFNIFFIKIPNLIGFEENFNNSQIIKKLEIYLFSNPYFNMRKFLSFEKSMFSKL